VVRRFAFTPRWIAWHVLMVIAVVTCVWLGEWQWLRSQVTGSLQNLAYALQWPLFAVFFAVMWWRMMRLESRRLDELEAEATEAGSPEAERADAEPAQTGPTGAEHEDGTGADPELKAEPAAETRPAPVSDDEDPELAAYNRMLARLAAQDQDAARR
jgi:DNA-binding transcriptional regulator of glucitol operon